MTDIMGLDQLAALIRDVPDFPKPGILFKDITPVLSDSRAFQALVFHLQKLVPEGTTKLAAIESRGFLLGAALAQRMNLGLALVRKPGKLPWTTHSHAYELEYGQDTLHLHTDAFAPGDKVCIIDDVLATGGTALAAEMLCRKTGAELLGFAFLIELGFLKGRARIGAPVQSLLMI